MISQIDKVTKVTCIDKKNSIYLVTNGMFGLIGYLFVPEEEIKEREFREVFAYYQLNNFSGSITTYLFSSLSKYSHFLELLGCTKKVSCKNLSQFVELDLIDRFDVTDGKKKITGLGPSSVSQLKGHEEVSGMKDMNMGFTKTKYLEFVNILKDVEPKAEKIKLFLKEEGDSLLEHSSEEIKRIYMSKKLSNS